MTVMLFLYIAIFIAALAGLLGRSRLSSHLMIGLAGAFGLAYGLEAHGMMGGIVPLIILVVAAVQVASVLGADRAARFSKDEEAMLYGPLEGLGRAQARRLLDQGYWIDGRPGDVLTREGQHATQLFYLVTGEAEVRAHGHLVGRVGAGQLIGEATVLGDAPATATVTLTAPSRFWCAQGQALNAYLSANPDARHALEHGFTISLREKLEAMNRAAAPIS